MLALHILRSRSIEDCDAIRSGAMSQITTRYGSTTRSARDVHAKKPLKLLHTIVIARAYRRNRNVNGRRQEKSPIATYLSRS
jgi:hypothetical protein